MTTRAEIASENCTQRFSVRKRDSFAAFIVGNARAYRGAFGLLRPADTLFCISGMPYDTLRGVIFGEGNGSLKDFGVNFEYVGLKDGKFDYEEISRSFNDKIKVVYIQALARLRAERRFFVCGNRRSLQICTRARL